MRQKTRVTVSHSGINLKGSAYQMKKYMWLFFCGLGWYFLGSVLAFADQTSVQMGSGIGAMATRATSNMGGLATLISAGAYVAGLGFAVGAILKLKAHKDNPQQTPLATGVAMLFVSSALIFTPSTFKATGGTMFGAKAYIAGVSGLKNLS